MGKRAWLLTHDDYIDRRIFFFVDVFRERGYDVRLFANEYYNPLCRFDYDYIRRPEVSSLVREYSVPDEKIAADIKHITDRIQQIRHGYKGDYATWVKSTDFAPEGVSVLEYEKDYVILFSGEQNEIVYDHYSGHYMICRYSENDFYVRNAEMAIIDYFKGKPVKKIETKYAVKMTFIDDNDGVKIYISPLKSRLLYIYDGEKLIEYCGMKPVSSELDIADKEYGDFKRYIFDYGYIFNTVKLFLKKEIPEVVYVADVTTLPIAIMLKEKYGCIIIMDCHEWWYKQTELCDPKNIKAQQVSKFYESSLYPECDIRITVGEAIAKEMELAMKCDFNVIYSCLTKELENISEKKTIDLKRKYHLAEDSKFALFQGTLTNYRNLENLARATRFLDRDCFLLFLCNSDGYFKDVKRIVNKEGNPKQVIWGGWIPQKELGEYTSSVSLGIIPYVGDQEYKRLFVPNKLMEFVAAKIPILYDNSMMELNNVVGRYGIGCGTDFGRPELIGKTINGLLHDDKKLCEYRNNYLSAELSLSYEEQRRKFEKILDDHAL